MCFKWALISVRRLFHLGGVVILWIYCSTVCTVINNDFSSQLVTALLTHTKYLGIWGLQCYAVAFFIPTALLCTKPNKNFVQTIRSLRLSKQKTLPYFDLTAGKKLWFPDIWELASKPGQKHACKSKVHITNQGHNILRSPPQTPIP